MSTIRFKSSLANNELQPNQIYQFKMQFLTNADAVFEKGSTEKSKDETEQEKLYKVISQLKVENDFFKESLVMNQTLQQRRSHVDKGRAVLSVTRQCELLSVLGSVLYYKPLGKSEENQRRMRMVDQQHLKRPWY